MNYISDLYKKITHCAITDETQTARDIAKFQELLFKYVSKIQDDIILNLKQEMKDLINKQ